MTTRRNFARAAIVLGAAAPLAGSPYAESGSALDIDELSRAVERGDDHIDAIELAQWIKDRRPGLRVIDLRSQAAFDEGHIPGAEYMPMTGLSTATFKPEETIVLYSEGGAHAGQAWVFLRARGLRQVFFLRSGAYEWAEQVMSPMLPVNATAAERAAFERIVPLSQYFDGRPRRNVSRAEFATLHVSLKRRGC